MRFAKNKHWWLIVIGTIVWSLTMIKSGLVYSFGMGFWGPNGHDGIWHLAVISGLSRFNLAMPIFAGEMIKNYHLGFDILVAALHLLTQIPSVNLYFQILPPIMAALIGFLVYKLTGNLWSVFFTYFGGSLGWILGKGESTFWSQQAVSTLLNPPYALSLILLLLLLLLLRGNRYILAGLVLGLLPQVKIYAGLLQLTANSYKLLVWSPGWYLETMMGLSDRLNWPKFYQAMLVYKTTHHPLKLPISYFVAFVIFLVGNLGTRILAFSPFRRPNGLLKGDRYFMWPVIILGVVIPMFFLQSGTPWNSLQFFYYTQFFLGILAGQAISKLRYTIPIILLTVPTTFQSFSHYLPKQPPAMISNEEQAALKFLSTLPPGVVLTYPAQPDAYAPAHPTFLEDTVNLDITGFSWRDRLSQVKTFFSSSDPDSAVKFIKNYNIYYIYLSDVAHFRPILSESQLGFKKLFENSQAAVWGKSNEN
ncbi:hypothetical protein HYS82_00620 [Candidatus Amesbacteria bacterium]|nr:hypothetical protein [Candidatus Amesbacteria bacterium]